MDEIRRVKEEIDYENAVCNICLVELALDKEYAPWGLKNCGIRIINYYYYLIRSCFSWELSRGIL